MHSTYFMVANVTFYPKIATRMARPPKQFKNHPFRFHEELTLDITDLTNQGDGVAKLTDPLRQLENYVIFVPFTAPGDKIIARIIHNAKNVSRAELVEILTPSPSRTEPLCPHFTHCGGCQYQHLSYPAQLQHKTQQITQLLQRLAGAQHPVNPTIPSPRPFHYRSKLTPHFRKPYNGKISEIGFHHHNSKQLIDIDFCHLALPEINEALPALKCSVRQAGKRYKTDETLLIRAASGDIATDPSTAITEHIGELNLHFLAGDFFQNNPYLLPDFVAYAAQQAKPDSPQQQHLIDAYCGSGLFALSLAKHFEQVTGIEISETATDWARQNARLNHLENTQFISACAEAIFTKIDTSHAQTFTVLIDPPRRGCSPDFLSQLIEFAPVKIVYISCEPATQMRDLSTLLDNGYAICDVQPFDLFPQTRHLECIITLDRV